MSFFSSFFGTHVQSLKSLMTGVFQRPTNLKPMMGMLPLNSQPFLGSTFRKSPGFGALAMLQLGTIPSNGSPTSSMLGGIRPVTYASFQKGKRKTVKTVIARFYRLHWGGWIRPKAGRHRKVYRKSGSMKYNAVQHVFCSGTQSHLLDKMVCKYWRRPKYYVDDPYESYHTRDNYYITRKHHY